MDLLTAFGLAGSLMGRGAPAGAGAATDALIQKQMAGLQGQPPGPSQMQPPQMGPPSPVPQMGPPSPQDDPLSRFRSQGPLGRIGGFLGNFSGNVGQTLEDPRKLLGIAGLSEIDPRLGMAGLLAGGIFGGRRGN